MKKTVISIIGLLVSILTLTVNAEDPPIPVGDDMSFCFNKIKIETGIDYTNSYTDVRIKGTKLGSDEIFDHTYYDIPSTNFSHIPTPKLSSGFVEVKMLGGSAYAYELYSFYSFSNPKTIDVHIYKSAVPVPGN